MHTLPLCVPGAGLQRSRPLFGGSRKHALDGHLALTGFQLPTACHGSVRVPSGFGTLLWRTCTPSDHTRDEGYKANMQFALDVLGNASGIFLGNVVVDGDVHNTRTGISTTILAV